MEPDSPKPVRRFTLHEVSVEGFEGPLDLLLTLIEQKKLDISGISLAAVTEQYLVKLKALKHLPPEDLADFLVVAATLLLLKSKRLFPDFALTDDEEEQVLSLEEQLREYRRFREAAKGFLRLWNRGRILHARESFSGVAPAFFPPPGFSIADFRSAMDEVVLHLPRLQAVAEDVVRRVISLEERIRALQTRIAEHARTTFHAFAESASSKVEVIVSFLALLELVKRRMVIARQPSSFRDILIEPFGPAP